MISLDCPHMYVSMSRRTRPTRLAVEPVRKGDSLRATRAKPLSGGAEADDRVRYPSRMAEGHDTRAAEHTRESIPQPAEPLCLPRVFQPAKPDELRPGMTGGIAWESFGSR